MSDRGAVVVVDWRVADAAGIAGDDHAVVVPDGARRGGGVDAIADAVAAAPEAAMVLVRPPWADARASGLAGIAMMLGRDLVWLPPGLDEAAWAAALIVHWARETQGPDLIRRAQVAVGLAALPSCHLPRRPWGCDGSAMPALVADSLARWCDRLWAPCDHCAGGGAPGMSCGRCGHTAVVA